jgi:peptidylprolyl isomerase
MKITIAAIGAVLAAVLVVISAGCVTPAAGGSPAAGTPSVTPSVTVTGTIPGIPALPVQGTPAAVMTASVETGGLQAAAKGDLVSIYYTGMFENGTVVDSNTNSTEPAEFTLGNSQVIEGIEDAVEGMTVNQQKTVTIPAGKAYGVYNASLIRTVNRTGPIADTPFVRGQYYTIRDKTTNAVSIVKILDVATETVTWDANDPLAGMDLKYTIKLVKISRP